jgi:hypothetical protein
MDCVKPEYRSARHPEILHVYAYPYIDHIALSELHVDPALALHLVDQAAANSPADQLGWRIEKAPNFDFHRRN